MLAHLVVPHGDDMVDDEVLYVSVHDGHPRCSPTRARDQPRLYR